MPSMGRKILVVDDEPSMRLTLSALLRKWGYQVVEAVDGAEAWALLQREPISMVICDWVMPRLDGLGLCRKLRAGPFSHYIYLILLTAKEQGNDLVSAFNAGVDDFATKPFNPKELKVRIAAGERVLRLEHRLNAKNDELTEANRALQQSELRVRQDLEAAAAVQRSLLPTSDQTGLPLRLAWLMRPADDLGGDIFGFHRLDDRRLAFYLIDVSGHGVRAAMFSVHLSLVLTPSFAASPASGPSAAVRPAAPVASQATSKRWGGFLLGFGAFAPASAQASPEPEAIQHAIDPAEVVARLNRGFQTREQNRTYFTMVYGIIDAYTGVGQLCQAGHPYPLLARRNGQIETLGDGGFPVGLIPEADYESVPFALDVGDRLLLYSDGVTECFSPAREPFGLERLSAELARARGQDLERMVVGIEQRLGGWCAPREHNEAAPEDDVSMLALERVGDSF